MTHDFLPMMLGLRPPGITFAALPLQEQGLISYNHGTMMVLDRQGLEAAACECYRIIRDEFARVLGASAIALGTSLTFSTLTVI
jgi:hypothetical protein